MRNNIESVAGLLFCTLTACSLNSSQERNSRILRIRTKRKHFLYLSFFFFFFCDSAYPFLLPYDHLQMHTDPVLQSSPLTLWFVIPSHIYCLSILFLFSGHLPLSAEHFRIAQNLDHTRLTLMSPHSNLLLFSCFSQM